MRFVPVPTARLAIIAALGALAVAVLPGGRAALLLVNGVLLGLAALDWARAPRPARLRITRELPGVVVLDTPAEVTWRVRNPVTRPVRVHLADELAPSLRAATRRATLRLPPGGQARASTTIRPARRGRFTPARVTVRVEGPLGLAARQDTVEVPGCLRVYPAFRSRAAAELRLRDPALLAGLRLAQGRSGGTEFDSLREYTIDDEVRRIDWAATARANRPIVRTYRAERNQVVLVLVDTGRLMAGRLALPGGALLPRLDHALDATLTLATVATRLGDRVGLVAFGDRPRAVVAPQSGRSQLGRMSEALFGLQPLLVESDYHAAFTEALARFRRRALLVVLTELAEHAVLQTLLPALPLVLRRHLVIVGGVRDPDVQRWARALPEESTTAYRKAAAVRWLAERARTAARLRRAGALVVDAEPARMAGLLADAYLEVKATAKL